MRQKGVKPLYPIILFLALFLGTACSGPTQKTAPVTAYIGARIIDGTGRSPIAEGTILVSEGKIIAVGKKDAVAIPENAAKVDLKGKTVIPGLINGHGHVGVAHGLESGYSKENVVRDLGTYARYGITTVVSLGDDQEPSVALRNAQNVPTLDRARLFLAGEIVTGSTPEAVKKVIDYDDSLKVDFIKVRIDDNLGTSPKMPPAIYKAIIDYAHGSGYRVATHIFYLADAKDLLKAGSDYIAHSVRDRHVDAEFIDLMRERQVPYCPTLMREVSTYVFGGEPDYYQDPFFMREVDSATVARLRDPRRMAEIAARPSSGAYRIALDTAMVNLKTLSEAGIPIVMGTDSGVAGRFPGYFEHLEMKLMQDAGMDPMEVLWAATGGAAKALGLADIGSLEPGHWADFIVLDKDPLEDIANTRSISSVWIAGNRVPR